MSRCTVGRGRPVTVAQLGQGQLGPSAVKAPSRLSTLEVTLSPTALLRWSRRVPLQRNYDTGGARLAGILSPSCRAKESCGCRRHQARRAPTSSSSTGWPRSAWPPCTRPRAAPGCWARTAPDLPAGPHRRQRAHRQVAPGDNWMIHVAVEQARPGDILVVDPDQPVRRRLFRRPAGRRASWRTASEASSSTPACATSPTLTEMAFPVWSRDDLRAGNGEGDARPTCRRRSCAPVRLIRPGDVIVADDDGVVVVPRERAQPTCSPKALARRRTRRPSARASPAASSASTSTPCASGSPRRVCATSTASETLMSQTPIPCTVMRGGTSKGLYFLAIGPARRPWPSATPCCLPPWAPRIRARSTAWAAAIR